jgi:hypothetical protein
MNQTYNPVVFVLHSRTKESPFELSPFIMMDCIEHETKTHDALNTPGCPKEERRNLDSNIGQQKA